MSISIFALLVTLGYTIQLVHANEHPKDVHVFHGVDQARDEFDTVQSLLEEWEEKLDSNEWEEHPDTENLLDSLMDVECQMVQNVQKAEIREEINEFQTEANKYCSCEGRIELLKQNPNSDEIAQRVTTAFSEDGPRIVEGLKNIDAELEEQDTVDESINNDGTVDTVYKATKIEKMRRMMGTGSNFLWKIEQKKEPGPVKECMERVLSKDDGKKMVGLSQMMEMVMELWTIIVGTQQQVREVQQQQPIGHPEFHHQHVPISELLTIPVHRRRRRRDIDPKWISEFMKVGAVIGCAFMLMLLAAGLGDLLTLLSKSGWTWLMLSVAVYLVAFEHYKLFGHGAPGPAQGHSYQPQHHFRPNKP